MATELQRRCIYFISDGTGITAETLGHSLMTQFPDVEFDERRYSFVDTEAKAQCLFTELANEKQLCGQPLVLLTVANPKVRSILMDIKGEVLDIFSLSVSWMSQQIGSQPAHRVGQAHSMVDQVAYQSRIDAVNYALSFDDGLGKDYAEADVILVGVSRSGKTPTCLYLALHYGVKAANYPLTDSDFDSIKLPNMLKPWQKKLFGLTIDPLRLSQIREIRRPGSSYANLKQCHQEVQFAENLFKRFSLPYLNTTETSIEEISNKVINQFKLEKRHF